MEIKFLEEVIDVLYVYKEYFFMRLVFLLLR